MSTQTWLVETEPDQFQTVRAQFCRIDAGTLTFGRLDGTYETIKLAFAAGQWITVCEDES